MNINWKDVGNAVVLAVLIAVIQYILSVGNIWVLDFKQILNTGVVVGLGVLLQALMTTREGKFAGAIPTREAR